MALLREYCVALRCNSAPAGGELGPGWTVRVRTRTVLLHGKERQQKDAFYCSPSGETYNSRRKVTLRARTSSDAAQRLTPAAQGRQPKPVVGGRISSWCREGMYA